MNANKIRAGLLVPMLSLAVAKLPEGPEWAYEVIFDGYRAFGLKADGRAQVLSRNGRSFTPRFASIARALEALPNETVIDGEIIAYDAEGHPSFSVLQNRLSDKPQLHFYAFDLLALRGKNLTDEPLDQRRALLRRKVMPLLPDSIGYSETLEASAAEVIDAVRSKVLRASSRSSATANISPASVRAHHPARPYGHSLINGEKEFNDRKLCPNSGRTAAGKTWTKLA